MKKNMTFHKRKIWVVVLSCILMMTGLIGRLVYLMCFRSDYYYKKAKELHEREREIKAARGEILDARGKVLASNRTVCTISVIHSQIKEPEKVIALLSEKLKIDEAEVRKRVEKISSIEIVKTNVEKSTGDEIRECSLAGVKVDEDYKRYYPCGSLASKVIGFTGGDNQGIIGLEVKYEEILKGQPGKILTTTDARGVEIDKLGETREKPIEGKSLIISLDVNIQEFAQQSALKVMEEKQAERVSILLMNPQNGEIYACVNVPEFDLNDPFTLTDDLNMQLNESGITIPSEDHNEQSELAVQTMKDPYIFDFIPFKEDMVERDIERALVQDVTKLLLELGTGFAFLGNQYHLNVGGDDFYIDLLFYNLNLRCYVVIELKTGEFKPEYAGQLNFYLSAVDGILKKGTDNPSIGLLLCKSKNDLVAEYSLKDMSKPIGVSEYKITNTLPKELEQQLPSVEDLQKRIQK